MGTRTLITVTTGPIATTGRIGTTGRIRTMATILGLRSIGPADIAITATTVIITVIIGNEVT
jgi:hypothetical protein